MYMYRFPCAILSVADWVLKVYTQYFGTENRCVLLQKKGALSDIFSSIAIELNVPRGEFSLIAIDLTFVTLGRGLKKVGSVFLDVTRIF